MLCDECKNDGICKYTGEARTMWEQTIQIAPNNIISPIKIKVECDRFEKKPQKQDGFNGTYSKGGVQNV